MAEDCFRIGGINVDNIPQIKAHRDNEKLFNDIKKHELDVVLMQEVGVYWNKVPWEDTFQARLNEYFERGQTRSKMSANTTDLSENPRQRGGTGIMTHGKMTHYSMGAGSDKLGRWTWPSLEVEEK